MSLDAAPGACLGEGRFATECPGTPAGAGDSAPPAGPGRPPGGAALRPARLPVVDTGRCTGCGRCVAACDLHLLSLEPLRWRKHSVLHGQDRCTGCSACAVVCPFHAITLRRPAPAADGESGAAPPPR